LKSKGKIVRGWLGVVIQKVTPELAKSFGLKELEGALVSDVMEDSPAAKAGIRRGDVIVSFDGKPIKEIDQLPRIVATAPVGKEARIRLIRDGSPVEVDVTISEGREETREAANTGPAVDKNYGMVVQNVTPEIAHHLNTKDTKGVIVTDIQQGSPADEADVRAGDIIREINRRPVRNVDEFREIVSKVRPKEGVVMLVKRENMTFYAVIKGGRG
jgi:serine protease Do